MIETYRNTQGGARRTLRPPHAFARPGFTLLELTLSLVVTAVILGALTSAMLLASQIIPGDQDPAEASIAANEIAARVAGELYYAQSLTKRSATEVEFTVADRNGDAVPETIRYAWSGSPGDPLKRKYNDGESAAVLDNVQELDLAYDVKQVTEETPSLPSESSEMQFTAYEVPNTAADFRITSGSWIGQCFQPALPAEAVSWRITRVRFKAKKTGGSGGVTMVQLRPADANGKPTATILQETPMYETDLTKSYSWQNFSFSNSSWLSPSTELCVVLPQVGKGGASAKISYDSQGGSGLVTSADGGGTWARNNGKSLVYNAYGTMTTILPPEVSTHYFLTSVEVTLQVGSSPPVQAKARARLVNRPEVASP